MEKYGDWDITLNMAQHLQQDVKDGAKIVLQQIALMAEQKAVKHIVAQDLNWTPLNQKYLAYKLKKRRSYKIYVSTSDYMQAITSHVNPQGTQSIAGVFSKKRNREGDIIADIGKTLEWGSLKQGIPARPLWRTTYDEVRRYLQTNPEFANVILTRILLRTGGKGKIG